MKPENIKKVWEYYRGYQIHYRIRRSQYIVDAINKNMNGDFSPSQFYNPIESQVHLIVQEFIKYLLEQEALEQVQQQTLLKAQQKEEHQETKVIVVKEKPHKKRFHKRRINRNISSSKTISPFQLFQQGKSSHCKLFNPSVASDSPPLKKAGNYSSQEQKYVHSVHSI